MAPPVKLGLNIVWVKPEYVVEYARLAEDLGFESVWSGEHVSLSADPNWWRLFPGIEQMGDAANVDMVPFVPESLFLDPMVVLAHVAAATKKVRLGIGIYMLALRDPILIGRTLASLDVLSNGRLDMAVGLGWTPDEYTFTNNQWNKRGRRMNEMIRCLRALFEQDTPEFHGEFFNFPPIGFQPKPVQKPRFPIHIGGGGEAAEKRAAELGDGWYGAPQNIPGIREKLKAAGRENDPFTFSTLSLAGPVSLEDLQAAAELGVDRMMITPWPGKKVGEVGAEGMKAVEDFAKQVGLV